LPIRFYFHPKLALPEREELLKNIPQHLQIILHARRVIGIFSFAPGFA